MSKKGVEVCLIATELSEALEQDGNKVTFGKQTSSYVRGLVDILNDIGKELTVEKIFNSSSLKLITDRDERIESMQSEIDELKGDDELAATLNTANLKIESQQNDIDELVSGLDLAITVMKKTKFTDSVFQANLETTIESLELGLAKHTEGEG